MILLPVQCRMARAALGLGVRELAAAAKVSIDTVTRFERGDELKERTIEALHRAFKPPASNSSTRTGAGQGCASKRQSERHEKNRCCRPGAARTAPH